MHATALLLSNTMSQCLLADILAPSRQDDSVRILATCTRMDSTRSDRKEESRSHCITEPTRLELEAAHYVVPRTTKTDVASGNNEEHRRLSISPGTTPANPRGQVVIKSPRGSSTSEQDAARPTAESCYAYIDAYNSTSQLGGHNLGNHHGVRSRGRNPIMMQEQGQRRNPCASPPRHRYRRVPTSRRRESSLHR